MSQPILPGGDIGLHMKLALRRLAKSVAVIACRHEGRRYAMAATAVSEITIDPPSLLICVNQGASIYLPLSAGAEFSVNILHASHRKIAESCSGKVKGDARFSKGLWSESATGIPYLSDAQGSFFCRHDGRLLYGTHEVFVGRVEAASHFGDVDPLVYVDGRFTTVRKSA